MAHHFIRRGDEMIPISFDDFRRLVAAGGYGAAIVTGEEHRSAFRDMVLDLWPDLIVLQKTSRPEKFTKERIKRWMGWTGLPIPGSHEAWKAVWYWVGLTPPMKINDKRITSELKPALLAKHRRDTQDKQRYQAAGEADDKRADRIATAIRDSLEKPKRAKRTTKTKQGEKTKAKQRLDDAKRGDEWLRGRNCGQYVTYNDKAVTKGIELWDLKSSLDRDRHYRADVWAAKRKPRRKKSVKTR